MLCLALCFKENALYYSKAEVIKESAEEGWGRAGGLYVALWVIYWLYIGGTAGVECESRQRDAGRGRGTGAGELRSEEQQFANSLGDRELLYELFGQKPANGSDAERLQIQRRRQPVDSHDGRRHLLFLSARGAPSATTYIVLTASLVTLVIETGVLRIVM